MPILQLDDWYLDNFVKPPEAPKSGTHSWKLALAPVLVVVISATAADALRREPVPASGNAVAAYSPITRVASPKPMATTSRATNPVFPVAGHERDDVVSRFGDSRDGGRRTHLGIDIAAPRGTAVLSVSDGMVERVENTRLGGRVVWVQEKGSPRRHYFAHLESIAVSRGQRVRAGQTLGTVGTTGNAVGTSPHLHYSVRSGDAVLDPLSLLRNDGPSKSVAEGRVMRTRIGGGALRSRPGGATIAIVPLKESIAILGDAGRFYRVRYRGKEGYLARWIVE